MSAIFGHLNLSDTDRVWKATQGQDVIYQVATEWIAARNAELDAIVSMFVDRTTSDHKRRFKLPAGGYLSRRAEDGSYAAAKQYGSWDVAYPLEDFGRQIAGDDVSMAYMTVEELDLHLQTVWAQNVNSVRFELLKAILNNTQGTFIDPLWGSLSIEPLANGDTVVYPPVLGSQTEATEDHYLESGYAATAITDTNNPYSTIKDELEHHFGVGVGGSDVVVFIHPDERPETEELTDFAPVGDPAMAYGDDTDLARLMPGGHPGVMLGRTNGVYVAEWRSLPSAYMVGVYLGVTPPLTRRIDPADTGLGNGLQLVAKDTKFPFESSFWRHRFGFGAGNRLNGVVMELGVGGTYSIPSGYS